MGHKHILCFLVRTETSGLGKNIAKSKDNKLGRRKVDDDRQAEDDMKWSFPPIISKKKNIWAPNAN